MGASGCRIGMKLVGEWRRGLTRLREFRDAVIWLPQRGEMNLPRRSRLNSAGQGKEGIFAGAKDWSWRGMRSWSRKWNTIESNSKGIQRGISSGRENEFDRGCPDLLGCGDEWGGEEGWVTSSIPAGQWRIETARSSIAHGLVSK